MLEAKCRDAQTLLNEHAQKVSGGELAFYVHYWGATTEHYDNPLHKHSFFEICYVVDGQGTYIDNGKEHRLAAGTLFCSRPGVWHQIRSKTGLFLLFVAFEVVDSESNGDAAQQFRQLAEGRNYFLDTAEQSPTAWIWKALLVQAAAVQAYWKVTVEGLAYSLLVSFLGAFGVTSEPAAGKKAGKMASTQLYRAKLFIRDNLSQPLRLDDVASYLHVSGRHLSRLFSLELGQTYSDYVRNQRVRQAQSLLAEGELSIKQIAQETGFESVHYFTRVFKAETGLTPGKFRERALRSGGVDFLKNDEIEV